MKSTGVIRNLDTQGRFCIPKEIQQLLKLRPCDPIEFQVHGRTIHLRKHYEGCAFCNTANAKLIRYNGLNVCAFCARHLANKLRSLD